jgi:site-specific DNA recombinase
MRAAAYVRVSTDEQAREGYGLAAQEQAARAYCQAQGWELVDVYADAGRSGKSLRGRQELARLLEDAQAKRFERVVFWKLDRLARNLRDLLDICDRLEALNVGIVSVQEAIDTGTPAGRMIRNVLGSLAEFERDIIIDRIKAGLAEKARQGELLGPLPLGYRRDETGGVIADPVIAPLVKDAFARYATGQHSLRDMSQWAARAGLRSASGRLIDRLSIRKILCNPSYTGMVSYHLRRGAGAPPSSQTYRLSYPAAAGTPHPCAPLAKTRIPYQEWPSAPTVAFPSWAASQARLATATTGVPLPSGRAGWPAGSR